MLLIKPSKTGVGDDLAKFLEDNRDVLPEQTLYELERIYNNIEHDSEQIYIKAQNADEIIKELECREYELENGLSDIKILIEDDDLTNKEIIDEIDRILM